MHLVIYTQKRDRPLIFKINVIVPVLLVLFTICLLALPIYFGFRNRVLAAATVMLDDTTARMRKEVLEADERISELEERIRYAEDHSTIPEVLFSVLSKTHALKPPDTVFLNLPGEYRRVPDKTGYAIQLSALKNRDAAVRVAGSFRATIPVPVEIVEADLPDGRWYRVIATGFESAREARNYALELKSNGIISDYVIQKMDYPYSDSAAGEIKTPRN